MRFHITTTTTFLASLLLLLEPSHGFSPSPRQYPEQRPENITFCDYYTQKAFGNTTAASQRLLMTLVLHSALLGPYSPWNKVPVSSSFTGALKPVVFQGQYVDLNGYFNGALASAYTGKAKGEALNFLDDGGLAAARMSKAGNGNVTSHQ
jgi:hypothetical protein